jgi:hypothetical protein
LYIVVILYCCNFSQPYALFYILYVLVDGATTLWMVPTVPNRTYFFIFL